MPDIKIVTEVAGRICALPVEAGASVGDGDDMVAEGQVLAILET
jgi:hypothetical protein